MNSVHTPATESFPRSRRWRRGPLLGVAGVVLIALVALLARMHAAPADLDRSTTQLSAQGHYQVSYTPRDGPLTLNKLHSWTLRVTTSSGEPVTDALVIVDGGMPQHGHGLPTQPQVTGHLGDGAYLVEGLKFQMPGWWVVDVTVEAGGTRDTVRFNLLLS